MANTNLNVKGMHCNSCEFLIQDALEEQAGINSIEVDHKTGLAKVDYDETKISQRDIKTIISNEGFKVE